MLLTIDIPICMLQRMNPLSKFLAAHPRLTQETLAERISRVAGWRVTQPQVSLWCTGKSVPSMANRLALERCTRGGVPAEAWDEIARRKRDGGRAVREVRS